MKKILGKVLVCLLAVCMALGMVACGDSIEHSMTTPGNIVAGTNGGFVAETENYVYYINGHTSYGDDNTFGTPVKGALMAAEKSSFATGNIKTEVVVPKLFLANDYSAGVYIYGDYVYYGTPSTDKNNDGDIARSEMTFTRTKLDGSETETFFTVDTLSYIYRFIENNGVVYLVYYNTLEQSLVCYNTSNGESAVIVKTVADEKGKFESLDKYSFLPGEGKDGLTLIYTVTVYAEDYMEEAANREGYERTKDTYNKVYAYRAGDGVKNGNENCGTVIFNGEDNTTQGFKGALVYSTTLFTQDFFAYSMTDEVGKSETKIVKTEEVVKAAKGETANLVGTKVDNTQYLTTSNVINDDLSLYTIVSGEDVTTETGETVASADVFVVKTSLVGPLKNNFKRLAKVGTASSLHSIKEHNGELYAYYYNSMVNFARIKLNPAEASQFEDFYKEERISEDSIASSWYEPEFVTVGAGQTEQTFVLYLDNTSKGASYIKYVKVFDAAKVGTDDTEEIKYSQDTGVVLETVYKDEEKTEFKSYALTGHNFIGEIISADTTNTAMAELQEIPCPLTWEKKEDGTIVVDDEQVKIAKAAYDALTEEGKKAYGEAALERLEGAQKAVEVIKKLALLDGIQNYEFLVSQNPAKATEFRNAYNAVKDVMEEIKLDNNVLDYIENNLKWAYYEKAVELFA